MTHYELKAMLTNEGFNFEYLRQERGGYKYHRITDTKGEGRLTRENKDLLWDIAVACEGHHYGYRVENLDHTHNELEMCIYVD